MERKSYSKAEDITDLSGIRVITFIESDARRVCDLITSSFPIHASDSQDKAINLGVDRFGYRSFHYVCDLGRDRLQLPEYSLYEGLLFEIQVRTVLQHAWAEIEHDRNYKFSGVLPDPLQRRLHLLAGVLEVVDREFVALATDIDRYAEELSKRTRSGDLDVEITTRSLEQYLSEKSVQLGDFPVRSITDSPEIISELRAFGPRTLAELDALFDEQFIAAEKKFGAAGAHRGLLRDAMMYHNLDHYFESAWGQHWEWTDSPTENLLASKYGLEKVQQTFRRYGIVVM